MWIVAWKKEEASKDKPTKLQINKSSIVYVEVFDDKIILHTVDNKQLILFLREWEISF